MAKIRLYRHPDCAKCARYARMHHRLDWLGRFEDSSAASPLGPLRKGQIVIEDLRRGVACRGAAALALLCRQIPAYWPLLPLLRIPSVRRKAERGTGAGDERRCDARRSDPAGPDPRQSSGSAGSDDRRTRIAQSEPSFRSSREGPWLLDRPSAGADRLPS